MHEKWSKVNITGGHRRAVVLLLPASQNTFRVETEMYIHTTTISYPIFIKYK